MNAQIKRIIVVLLVIGIVGSFCSCGAVGSSKKSSNNNETTQSQTNNGSSEKAVDYTVGDAVIKCSRDSIGTVWITVGIPVKNTGNAALYLSSGTVDIENSDGKLETTLKSVSGYPQVLQPGETAYYYEETTYDGTQTTGLKAIPHIKVEKAKVDCIRLKTSEERAEDGKYGGTSIIGRVENTTGEEQTGMVYIVANLFDKNGKFISQMFTIITEDLAAGEKMGFELTSLMSDKIADKISKMEVYAFPYQYQF